MTDLQIRTATIADVPTLAAWAQAMALETERKRLDPATVNAGVHAVLEQPRRGIYYLAVRDAIPVGTLMLTWEWSDWRCGDWWWIQSVYVAPAWRRQGVYRALHAHVQALAAASAEVCGLRLYVERDNAAAQRTYQALGMRDAGYRVYEAALPAAALTRPVPRP